MTTFLSPCVLDAMPANKTLYCIKQTVCDHVNRMWKNWVIQDFFLFRIYWWIEGFIFQLVACLYWNFVKSWSFWWVPVGQCGSYGCPRRLGLGPQRPSQRNAGKLSFYFATLASRVLNFGSFREFCDYPQEWERTEWKERKDLEAETEIGQEVGTETAGGRETKMKGGGEKTYSFWKINKIRLESLGGGLGGMSGFFSDVSTEQKNKILGVIVSHVEGPDPGTVVIVERSRPRGASPVCTGMCRPLGLSTSRLCSTRACSRAARSPPPWCRTHRR